MSDATSRPSPEAETLAAAVRSGHDADRKLAAALGHEVPDRRTGGAAYLHEVLHRAELAHADEQRLVRAAQDGDPLARERLIEAFLPRIAALARRYWAPGVERQELIQEGVLGLLAALRRYDPDRGTPFWAFAHGHVQRAIQRLVGELVRPVTLSKRAQRELARLRCAELELAAELRREPTRAELASRTGLSPEHVAELQAAARAPRSTEAPIRVDDATGAVGKLEDRLIDARAEEDYEHALDRVEAQELLALLSGLSARERAVLRARLADEQPLAKVAEQLGVDPEHARQIERRARAKLRAGARSRGLAA